MQHRTWAIPSARNWAVAIAIASATLAPAVGQQAPVSPLAGATTQQQRYADGGRLKAQYEAVNQAMSVPAARPSMRAAATGLAAAANIQPSLPDGFSLMSGATSHVAAMSRPLRADATLSAATPSAAAGADEKFITTFPLAYQGIPLTKGSDYLAISNGEGRLLVTRKRGVPSQVGPTQPTLTAQEAIALARQAAGAPFAAIDWDKVKAVLEIWVDDQQNGLLSWTFSIESASLVEPAVRRYWVAATGEPRVLQWESEVFHTQNGVVSGNLWATSPQPVTANRVLEQLELTRSTDLVKVITGADGRYGYATASGSAEIRAKLRGPFFVVQNQSAATMESAQIGAATPPINLNFGAVGDDQVAQISAFYWSNQTRDVARNILGPADLAALPVKTNINSNCNAFWNGSSINFFKAGGGCPNTAYADVVAHEYGHGIDAVKGGILDGGYSEGFGDAMAVLVTRQACVGRDFFGAGTCLRRASDIVLWPQVGGVHQIGRPYGGFVWELIQQLKQSYSEDDAYDIAGRLVVAAAAANPSSVQDAVHLSFIADDTDGNLTNGTPHFRALANAADSRKIPRPADPQVAGGAAVGQASFPWTPAKVVSANANILQATVHMDKPGVLHISANTSARGAAGTQFQTGVYNGSSVGVMWTDSFRSLSIPAANQWVDVSTMFAINLPAGDHTIYWKIWIAGGSVTLSGGALLLEAFEPAGGPMAIALADVATSGSDAVASAARVGPSISKDEAGRPITVLK